ncbi:MAG: hypothetical protein AB1391_01610 [Candidatus Micrarchaeota archaeon]
MGRSSERDVRIVQRLLVRINKKNLILAHALLSAITKGEHSEQDVKKFAYLLDLANKRIIENKEPFSTAEKEEIEEIFKRHLLSIKAAKKFTLGIDELLAMELNSKLEEKILLSEKQQEIHQQNKDREKEKQVY